MAVCATSSSTAAHRDLRNILTAEVKRDGLGSVDPAASSARSIRSPRKQNSQRPVAADVFDDGFLPPVGGRRSIELCLSADPG